MWYGRRGYQPQDQSIIFDGGWRTLKGQVPLRDYVTPSGILPSLMQGGLFKLLGVSWRTYCLHAAILNVLFCVLVYVVLSRLRTARLVALALAVGSSLIFYAPFGVPYMEQHAFFFVLLATWILVESSTRQSGRVRAFGYVSVPVIVGLAALSKQLPTVFFPPVALALVLLVDRRPASALKFLGVGTIATGAILLALISAFHIPLGDVIYYMVKLPLTGALPQRGVVASIVPLPRWRLVAPSVTYGGVLSVLLFTALPDRRRNGRRVLIPSLSARVLALFVGVAIVVGAGFLASVPDRGVFAATLGGVVAATCAFVVLLCWASSAVPVLSLNRIVRAQLILGGGLLLVCALFTSATNNELENGIPFDFLTAGLVLAALTGIVTSLVSGRRRRIALTCIGCVFLGAVLVDAG
ncbi:MAG: hypothetical protein H0X25_22180, partial [Acidobacteriales bacterium]|nr:hypothetical protein [Terriglobales bacterium]